MKMKNLGSTVRVYVSAAELDRFADTWPCSGMRNPSRGMSFEFERNGDLVDITGQRAKYDESAVLALSQDCQQFAKL